MVNILIIFFENFTTNKFSEMHDKLLNVLIDNIIYILYGMSGSIENIKIKKNLKILFKKIN